jgi:hypothetical protein
VRKLLGLEDARRRLDTLTMEEIRVVISETLNITHNLETKGIKQGRSGE